MTLKEPRYPPDVSGAGPACDPDDECTRVGPPSGAMLEALRAPADPNVEQAALDELVDLTIDFEEPPTVQLPAVPLGAVVSHPRPNQDRAALFIRPAKNRQFIIWLLMATVLVLFAIGGTMLIRR